MMLSEVLYRTLAPACALGGVVAFAPWMFPARRWPRGLAVFTLLLGTAGLAAAWGARWAEAGHLPLFGTYESALSMAVAVAGAGLAWELGRGRPGVAAPVALLIAAGMLAHGLGYDDRVFALTISERSWVVDVHAFVAWIAFGVLTVNAAVALRLVFGAAGPRLERWLVGSLSAGFLLHSGMMVSGVIYKFLLFGKVWSFDPMEIMGFVAWMAYGTLLHLHLLARWPTRRLAAWTLFVFVLLVVSYRAIIYFPSWTTYHIFDVDLRMHIPR